MNTVLNLGLKRVSRASIVLSTLLIALGLLAIALPMATSIGVAVVIGWLVVFDGIVQLVHAFESKGVGHVIWKLLVGVLYLVAGAYLVAHPALATAGLTLALGIFLFAEGVTDVAAYLFTRKGGRSLWMLADGMITLVLGVMIWNRWPFGSLWIIGTLVGVSMVMTGITRLMMALSIRRAASHIVDQQLRDRAA
jgi:uncharacterized membrane protein HdeD (DUF308 family)